MTSFTIHLNWEPGPNRSLEKDRRAGKGKIDEQGRFIGAFEIGSKLREIALFNFIFIKFIPG